MPPEAFFSGPGLDRADALRGDSDALARLAADPQALELVWKDGFPAVDEDGRLEWRKAQQPALFLGFDGVAPRFTQLQGEVGDVRKAIGALNFLSVAEAPLFAAALSLAGWHLRHGFCASCGASSEPVRGGWSRRCGTCSAEHFPRVDPVVIMLAEHDGSLLLGRQPHYPPGRFSALAGFVEVGETIEAAVARELHEEAGIRVENVRYVASQPWPFPSSLMIGCTASALDRALTIDTTELDDARWFTRDQVAGALDEAPGALFQAPPRWAIARTLLERWLAA